MRFRKGYCGGFDLYDVVRRRNVWGSEEVIWSDFRSTEVIICWMTLQARALLKKPDEIAPKHDFFSALEDIDLLVQRRKEVRGWNTLREAECSEIKERFGNVCESWQGMWPLSRTHGEKPSYSWVLARNEIPLRSTIMFLCFGERVVAYTFPKQAQGIIILRLYLFSFATFHLCKPRDILHNRGVKLDADICKSKGRDIFSKFTFHQKTLN